VNGPRRVRPARGWRHKQAILKSSCGNFRRIGTDKRASETRKEAGDRPDVFTYSDDCNTVFLTKVFPRADYGRYKRDKSVVSKVAQMTRLWGDDSWLDAGYDNVRTLFDHSVPVKVSNERFAEAFRERLEKKAGFRFVPKPMPMKTRNNSVIYYLYFASQKEAGMDIVNDIFNKYRLKQGL